MYRTDRFKRKKDYIKYVVPYAKIIHEPAAIVVNKDGSLQTTWLYRGPDLDSSIKEQLSIITQQLNSAFMVMETGWVLYFEAQRKVSDSYDGSAEFPDKITAFMDEERKNFFSRGYHFESDYYATAYWMPPNDNEGRVREVFVEGRKRKDIRAEDHIEAFCVMVDKIFAIFTSLQIPARFLSQDEMLTYLYSTVSDYPRALKMPKHPLLLDHYLCGVPLYGGLEPRLGRKHLRVITPTVYTPNTVFGLLDSLNQLNFSYRWVTRYFCLSKRDAISEVEGIQKEWYGKLKSLLDMFKEPVLDKNTDADINANAQEKYDQTKDAVHAIEGDVTSYGYYSTMVMVMDEDLEICEQKAKTVLQTFVNLGFRAQIEDMKRHWTL